MEAVIHILQTKPEELHDLPRVTQPVGDRAQTWSQDTELVILTTMLHSCLADFVSPPARTQNKCAAEHFGRSLVTVIATTLLVIAYQLI